MKLFGKRLVPYWRRAPRMFSVQAVTLQTAFLGSWALLPSEFKEVFPVWLLISIGCVLLLFGLLGAVIPQPKVTNVQKSES